MNWGRLRSSGNEHVFKGSQLVSSILERHPKQFRSRATALKFCRQLFNDKVIKAVFGADTFEDSVQLYTWQDKNGTNMTSYPVNKPRSSYGFSSADVTLTKRDLYKHEETIKPAESVRYHSAPSNHYTPNVNSYFNDLVQGLNDETDSRVNKQISSYNTTWNLQRASTASSESSVDILSQSYPKNKDKHSAKPSYTMPTTTQTRDHDVIPEEAQEERVLERTSTSIEYDGSSSFPRSTTTDTSAAADDQQRRWQDYQMSYSDNEKQLIEQMKRMKKEHSHILRTYEDRINKLMAKMHELRSIAEMLENSSTKSSPYGMIPAKTGILSLLGSRLDHERRPGAGPSDGDQPPPLPPRPGRGSRPNPNKPVIMTQANMTSLPWSRIILKDEDGSEQASIWHTMMEPKLDAEDIERFFSCPEKSQTDGVTLLEDLIIRRGRSRHQLVSIYDTERSKRIVICMKCLRATLNDVISTVSSLDTSQINHDSFVELLELLTASSDIEKILYHVRKKGAGQLDHPEYLVFELSKVDHFKDRLEFVRFRYKMQWHLFEIEQQLRELHTACDEITNSIALKNLLETLLAVGNYLNGATDLGQADGYGLDILNKLKETHDRDGKGTLLEFVLKTYCQIYESEVDIGCPTRFRLPEPSNMRHAAQVSFEAIQDALSNLHSDLRSVREKLLDPKINKDTTRPLDSFRVTAENFFAAALEVIGEQEKVLQDTRDVFIKTVSFFLIENPEITPQQFFQTWAMFLHDCKYFWKLAHRRLARERFELEFNYKGQMSASSEHGYGIFKAGVASAQSGEPKTSTQQRKRNSWVEKSLDPSRPNVPNVPPKPSRDNTSNDHRTASPKPLTSNPPTSEDVHKPLPKAPIVSSHQSPNSSSPPNYENQSDYDRFGPKQSATRPTPGTHTDSNNKTPQFTQTSNVVHDSKEKKSQQFSLKSWLKREREQVRRGVENEASPQSPEVKPHNSSRSFSKLKSSVLQKFSGSHSNKKHEQGSKRHRDVSDAITPQKVNRYTSDHVSTPYDVLRNNYPVANGLPQPTNEQMMPPYPQYTDSTDDPYKRSSSEVAISPIDDPEIEDQLQTTHMSPTHVNFGVVSPEIRITNTEDQDRLQTNSDFNNNDKNRQQNPQYLGPSWHQHTDQGANRHTGYTPRQEQYNDDHHYHHHNPSNINDGAMVSPGAESKRVKAQVVPVYKAKIINNYENQGKFESSHAVRQQAEPVGHGRTASNDTMDTTEVKTRTYSNPYSRFRQTHSKDNRDTYDGNQHTNSGYQPGQRNITSDYRADNPHYQRHDRNQNVDTNFQETPKKPARLDNQRYLTPGNRAPMNAQSIGSLIDKFDQLNNNESDDNIGMQADYNTPVASEPLSSKPAAMTSTPVSPRKLVTNGDISEASPPLPPRSIHSHPRSDRTPVRTDNTMSDSSKMTQADTPPSSSRKQSYRSAYDRLDILTSGHSGVVSQNNTYTSDNSTYNSQQHYKSTPVNQRTTHNNARFSSPSRSDFRHANAQSRANQQPRNTAYRPQEQIHMDHNYHRDPDNQHRNDHSQYNGYMQNGHVQFDDKEDQLDDNNDGYRAQLRRAANTTAFDRYGKLGPPSRPSSGSVHSSPGSTGQGSSMAVVKPTVNLMNNEGVSYMAF